MDLVVPPKHGSGPHVHAREDGLWCVGYTGLRPGPVDPETFAALEHACGIEFVGPPPAVSDPL